MTIFVCLKQSLYICTAMRCWKKRFQKNSILREQLRVSRYLKVPRCSHEQSPTYETSFADHFFLHNNDFDDGELAREKKFDV